MGSCIGAKYKRPLRRSSLGEVAMMANLMSKQNPSLGGRLWGVFKGEKVGFRPAMEVVAESNPKSPFPLKYGL